MLEPVECTAKDEERPFFPNELDGGWNWAGQCRFLEPVDMRRQRISRHKPFSPLLNLIKAQNGSNEQLHVAT
jgi:hypothetical protein